MKRCRECGVEKPADRINFAVSKGKYLDPVCRPCRRRMEKARRIANQEYFEGLWDEWHGKQHM